MTRNTPSCPPSVALAFLGRLAAAGVDVPGLDQYTALMDAQPGVPEPSKPLLDHTPAEFVDFALKRATATIGNNSAGGMCGQWSGQLSEMRNRATSEMLTRLAERADDIIIALRKTFDPAAEAIRRLVVDRQVPPWATVETLFEADDDTRRAWLDAKTIHAPALDRVLELRQDMSTYLRIPPDPDGIRQHGEQVVEPQWGVCVIRDGAGPFHPQDGGPHVRWMQEAGRLHLATVSEIDPISLARAEGIPVDRLLTEARRRDADGLAVPETDVDPSAAVDLSGAYLAQLAATEPKE